MKAEAFSHEIVGTSRTFYRSQDLRVVIEGDKAKTDGSTVYIPAMDMSKEVGLDQQRITRGYVDHEAGHGRHTDMDVIGDVVRKGYKYAPMLGNAIEDVRIEGLICKEYPGAQKNLEAVSDAVNKLYLKHAAKDPTIGHDFKKVGAVAITWEGRRRLGYDVPSAKKCLDSLSPDVRARVEKTVDVVMGIGSTKEAYDIAVTLDGELSSEPGAPPPSPGGGKGAPAGAGKPGGDTPEMYNPEAADALSDLADRAHSRGGGYRVWTWEKDRFWRASDKVAKLTRHKRFKDMALSSGESVYEKSKNSIAAHVNQMRRKLERALITKQNRGWMRNQEEGVIDSRRLMAAYAGATNVHRAREPVDDLDVAVLLVVDLSGSMNGEKVILARKAAICYAEALEKVQIPFAIAGFTNSYDEKEALNPAEDIHSHFYRNYPLNLYVFKDFDQPLKRAKPGIGCISGEAVAMGDNADGDSLLQLYWKLLKPRREQRTAMIVFSDGHPAASGGNQDQRLRDVVSYLEDEKVELIGVGILSEAPKKYYKKHVIVETVADLAKASLDQLAKLLIDPKFKVDNTELMGVSEKLKRGRT